MKTCTSCKTDKELTEFNRNRTMPDGLCSYCRECHKKFSKAHYTRHKAQTQAKNKRRYKETVEFVRKCKAAPCKDCGKSYPYYIMQFDHLRDKDIEIAVMARSGYSIERIKREMEKCDLVCANCHCERSHQRRQAAIA